MFIGLVVGDQRTTSDISCQLTNTCYGRTIKVLTSKRFTTLKTTVSQGISTTLETARSMSANTPVSIHTADEPSSDSKDTSEVTKTFTVALTTEHLLKSTQESKTEEGFLSIIISYAFQYVAITIFVSESISRLPALFPDSTLFILQ